MPKNYNRKDKHYQNAKSEGYFARSIYKLEEIDKKYKIFPKSSCKILDLGCSPGSWSQYALKKNPENTIFGIDVLDCKLNNQKTFHFHKGDIKSKETILEAQNFFGEDKLNLIMSDSAPNLSGSYSDDHMLSVSLVAWGFLYANALLRPGASYAAKVFPGQELEKLRKIIKPNFQNINVFIPESVRKSSKEVYLIAKGFKSAVDEDLLLPFLN